MELYVELTNSQIVDMLDWNEMDDLTKAKVLGKMFDPRQCHDKMFVLNEIVSLLNFANIR